MQDKELVVLCHQGQTELYALLVERYQRLIFGLALQFLSSREDAEDATQEAFIRVYQRIEKNQDVDFLPYAKRVVANLCLDRLRRRQVETNYVARTHPTEVVEQQTPEGVVVEQDEKHTLQQALTSLPPMYREVLLFCYVSELPYQQIADKLGLPLSIVKNRIYRGKRLLKDAYLQKQGGCHNGLSRLK